MQEFLLYIDGKFVDTASARRFESINPFNRSLVGRFAQANETDVDKAVGAARRAFDHGPWPRMTGEERGKYLKTISDKINERKDSFERLEVEDSGGTIRKVKEDVYLSARAMNYFSRLATVETSRPVDGLSKPGFSENILLREPMGVVAAITPWNFPLKMAIWKLGPALAAGNTVVIKPSELAPATSMMLAQIFHETGFPPGVVNFVTGLGSEAGEAMIRHPGVDKISFTGSTRTGRHVMAAASSTLKKCTLECGGKSANIVLDDADVDLAVDGALYAAFYHQGQCCEAGTRLFLPASLSDEFISRMVKKVAKMNIGDPGDMSTDIGPVISAAQRDKIFAYIQQGQQEGADLVVGGTAPSDPGLANGFFVAPTIFSNVRNSMTIAQEEIFGPVLSVINYSTADEAVSLANDSIYGLGGGVWSQDREKALSVARRLRAGTVWINEWHLISEKAAFGGYKQSGIGREFGIEGLIEYMETKHLHIDELGNREKKFWYDTVVPHS